MNKDTLDGVENKVSCKLLLRGKLKILTGLHIGSSDDFSHIGAVNNIIIRDPLTKAPIIPGSSLKGKLRTLLAKYIFPQNTINKESVPDDDKEKIKNLFGAAKPDKIYGRLQFFDLFMNKDSIDAIKKKKTDLYLTEIKFENTISRTKIDTTPRQIERVPSGAIFDFRLVYNVVVSYSEVKEDFEIMQKAFSLLHYDYLGGSGSRGYGRVELCDMTVDVITFEDGRTDINKNELEGIMKNVQKLLSV